mmetsp:Transcript_23163/g.40823  ORF Transcript_23163/g.40823 Transcript_23163/m.40823 type:complete len:148 (+) Transcript_23163:54-497(+)
MPSSSVTLLLLVLASSLLLTQTLPTPKRSTKTEKALRAVEGHAGVSEEARGKAALLQRGQHTQTIGKLDAAIKKKSGLPKGDEALVSREVPYNPPDLPPKRTEDQFPAAALDDLTVQVPPDADGDADNTPADGWIENKAPSGGKDDK